MSLMQNKNCGKCEKIVYPAEEIKCLDKFWHKGCFKCTVCGMTLNVKNVKGYNKMPYCNVHYPQPKPTVVVDNPEMQRIRLLTDIQSTAKYHEDFNKSKGKFTVVADDPAMTRAKEHQRVVSQAEYTGKRKESSSNIIAHEIQQIQQHQNGNRASAASERSVGRVADYDPLNNDRGSLARGYEPTSQATLATKFEPTNKNLYQPTMISSSTENGNRPHQQQTIHHEPQQHTVNSHGDGRPAQLKVRALYSYTASEADEISFDEGDTIVECEEIDAGWMLGRHPITGKQGLLPSNYVEILD